MHGPLGVQAPRHNPPTRQPASPCQKSEEIAAAAFKKALELYNPDAPEQPDEYFTYLEQALQQDSREADNHLKELFYKARCSDTLFWVLVQTAKRLPDYVYDSHVIDAARFYVVRVRKAGTYGFESGMFLLKTLFNIAEPGERKDNFAFTITKTYEHEIARRSQQAPSSDELKSMQEEAEKYRGLVPESNYLRGLDQAHSEDSAKACLLCLEYCGGELGISPHFQEIALDCLLKAIAKDPQKTREEVTQMWEILTSITHKITPTNAKPIYECIGLSLMVYMFMKESESEPWRISQDQKNHLLDNLVDILVQAKSHSSFERGDLEDRLISKALNGDIEALKYTVDVYLLSVRYERLSPELQQKLIAYLCELCKNSPNSVTKRMLNDLKWAADNLRNSQAAYWYARYTTKWGKLDQAADQGHFLGQEQLKVYWHAKSTKLDRTEEIKYYRIAADQGHFLAQKQLTTYGVQGYAYLVGIQKLYGNQAQNVRQDVNEAIKYLEQAVNEERDHRAADLLYVHYHANEDRKNSKKYFQEAVKLGSKVANLENFIAQHANSTDPLIESKVVTAAQELAKRFAQVDPDTHLPADPVRAQQFAAMVKQYPDVTPIDLEAFLTSMKLAKSPQEHYVEGIKFRENKDYVQAVNRFFKASEFQYWGAADALRELLFNGLGIDRANLLQVANVLSNQAKEVIHKALYLFLVSQDSQKNLDLAGFQEKLAMLQENILLRPYLPAVLKEAVANKIFGPSLNGLGQALMTIYGGKTISEPMWRQFLEWRELLRTAIDQRVPDAAYAYGMMLQKIESGLFSADFTLRLSIGFDTSSHYIGLAAKWGYPPDTIAEAKGLGDRLENSVSTTVDPAAPAMRQPHYDLHDDL